MTGARLTTEAFVDGVLAGDRTVLAQAITLVESTRPGDQPVAQAVLERVLGRTGNARRVGITGVPGVGKSTFIETLGLLLLEQGHRVAVLAIDPSSSVSGGSILGDKTRMAGLAADPRAFIRPSPSANSLGGVTRRTREAMLLCEAAGFDVVLVETVGVGQSETVVAGMVDFFLLLLLAGAGDELQGIKRGLMELADVVAINKADGDNLAAAERARLDFQSALHFIRPRYSGWTARAVAISSLTGAGLPELWELIEEHARTLDASGELGKLRREQNRSWMWDLIGDRLMGAFRDHAQVSSMLPNMEQQVLDGQRTPASAVDELLAAFRKA